MINICDKSVQISRSACSNSSSSLRSKISVQFEIGSCIKWWRSSRYEIFCRNISINSLMDNCIIKLALVCMLYGKC